MQSWGWVGELSEGRGVWGLTQRGQCSAVCTPLVPCTLLGESIQRLSPGVAAFLGTGCSVLFLLTFIDSQTVRRYGAFNVR